MKFETAQLLHINLNSPIHLLRYAYSHIFWAKCAASGLNVPRSLCPTLLATTVSLNEMLNCWTNPCCSSPEPPVAQLCPVCCVPPGREFTYIRLFVICGTWSPSFMSPLGSVRFVEPKKKPSCKFKLDTCRTFEGREFVFVLKEMRNGLYYGVSSHACQHKDFCKKQFVNTMQRSTYLNNVSKSWITFTSFEVCAKGMVFFHEYSNISLKFKYRLWVGQNLHLSKHNLFTFTNSEVDLLKCFVLFSHHIVLELKLVSKRSPLGFSGWEPDLWFDQLQENVQILKQSKPRLTLPPAALTVGIDVLFYILTH